MKFFFAIAILAVVAGSIFAQDVQNSQGAEKKVDKRGLIGLGYGGYGYNGYLNGYNGYNGYNGIHGIHGINTLHGYNGYNSLGHGIVPAPAVSTYPGVGVGHGVISPLSHGIVSPIHSVHSPLRLYNGYNGLGYHAGYLHG